MDKYILEKVLGKGKFGIVFEAVRKEDGLRVAIKVIKKSLLMTPKMYDQVETEINILTITDHSCIVKMIENFETKTDIFIVMEHIEGGDLYQQLKREPIEETLAIKYIRQIIEGLEHLHSMNIVHRDIKPDNILVMDDRIKICDFGWSCISDKSQHGICGTLDYICPEMVRNTLYNKTIDLWCLGVLTYELLTGKLPFYNITYKGTYKRILKLDYKIPNTVSDKAKDFISLLLRESEERMGLEEALNHPWLVNDKN